MESLCGQMKDKGVIVWEGRKCHTNWHHHHQHRIHPSPALRTQGTGSRPGRGMPDVPEGCKRWKGRREDIQPGGKERYLPPLSQTQKTGGRRKKTKTEAAFTIFTSNKTSQGTILIAQSGPWVGDAFIPQVERTRRIRTQRGHQYFLRRPWDSSSSHLLKFKALQSTAPWDPIPLLFFTIHNNFIRKGAVALE